MKKTALATIFISSLLLSAVAGISLVRLGKANPYYEERRNDPPLIFIYSPLNGTSTNNCLLNFTVTKPDYWVGTPTANGLVQSLNSIVIEIDGKYCSSATDFDSSLATPFHYATYLNNVTQGHHNLTVTAHATGFAIEIHGLWKYSFPINSSSVVRFTVVEQNSPTPTSPTPTPIVDPYPIWLLSISYVAIAVLVVGLLFSINKYFKGKKH